MKWKLLLFLVFLLCFSSVRSGLLPPEAEALMELKSSFRDPHGLLSGWDPDGGTHHCSWPGVTCDPAGLRVVALNVSGCDDPPPKGETFDPSPAYPALSRRRRLGCGKKGGRKLGGMLSPWVGRLRELRVLWLPFNELGGEVPLELWGLEKLEVVNLEGNLFTGLGAGGSHLVSGVCKLRVLNLGFNRLRRGVVPGWLSQCGDLEVLDLAGNGLRGGIPRFVFGFVKLRGLYLGGNELRGSVPGVSGDECYCRGLEHLDLSGNSLVGRIPGSLGRCWRLKTLLLHSNMFTGVIPRELGQLRGLEALDVSRNFIRGRIPVELGNCIGLSVVVLSNLFETWPMGRDVSEKVEAAGLLHVDHGEHNRFHGSIPVEITTLPDLKVLWAPVASLGGKLPSNWGECTSLEMVSLAHNELHGEIDELLMGCKRLHHLDLSSNRLTGKLDKKLLVPCMTFFDVSRNFFSGLEPRFNYCGSSQAVSSSLNAVQILQQGRKTGAHIRSLAAVDTSLNDGKKGYTPIEIASIVSASAVVFVLLAVAFFFFCSRKRILDARIQDAEPKEITTFVEIGVPLSYEIIVQSTGNFNASNCIGSGGFGATYKAEISPGTLVAVKRLAIGRVQGVQQFHAEIKALGRVKHRNLVTLIGYHASEAEMFLIYNYLARGNLADFIMERSERAGNWKVIHKIALDIARALAYLHDECSPQVLHRDIKPSNILLDGDCNAYLSDFGLSRLMGASQTHVTTGVHGTYGYVSPEYALTNRVSDKSDVYSYGVVLLELVSDKRALDPSFSAQENGYNIVSWATMLLQQGKAKEVFTPNLWDSGPHDDLVGMLHVAIMCTIETLSFRPTMKHVVRRLKLIRPN